MGANEKHAATYHGGEYTPTLDDLRDLWVDHKLDPLPRTQGIELVPTVQAEFDLWLAEVRAEAKAEALNEAAAEIDRLESIGDTARNQVSEDQEKDYWRFHGTPITDWLRDRTNQGESND